MCLVKTKALISKAVTALLICVCLSHIQEARGGGGGMRLNDLDILYFERKRDYTIFAAKTREAILCLCFHICKKGCLEYDLVTHNKKKQNILHS